MSCQADEPSPIVGVMLDGFPLYGPMQYMSVGFSKRFLAKILKPPKSRPLEVLFPDHVTEYKD